MTPKKFLHRYRVGNLTHTLNNHENPLNPSFALNKVSNGYSPVLKADFVTRVRRILITIDEIYLLRLRVKKLKVIKFKGF